MAKDREEILSYHARKKLNIIKGFEVINKTPLLSLESLVEQVGKENVYTSGIVKGFVGEVISKGDKDSIEKAQDTINNLLSFNVVDSEGKESKVYVEKGHMNFNGSGNLVQKKIADKNGKQTTRWVKNGEDEKETKEPKKEEVVEDKDSKEETGMVSKEERQTELRAYGESTDSEDLKEFIEASKDDESLREEVEMAKTILSERDEPDGGGGTEDEIKDWNEKQEGVEQEKADQAYIQENKEAIVEMLLEDPLMNISTALKLHRAQNGSNEETHGKIDAAQAALDDLKSHSGHPDSKVEESSDEPLNLDDIKTGDMLMSPDGEKVEAKEVNEAGMVVLGKEDGTTVEVSMEDVSNNYKTTGEVHERYNDNSSDEVNADKKDSNGVENSEEGGKHFEDSDEQARADDLLDNIGSAMFESPNVNPEDIREDYSNLQQMGLSPEQIKEEIAKTAWGHEHWGDDEMRQESEEMYDSIIAKLSSDSE